MRTNIVLDDDLVEAAFAYSRAKTKRALINEALAEYIANHRRMDLRLIEGKISFHKDYDYKKRRGEISK